MKKIHSLVITICSLSFLTACNFGVRENTAVVKPVLVTEASLHDTDDPAIWVNAENPAESLILGTDKDEDGALYVYNLQGKIIKVIKDLKRPNNVDVEYGLVVNGKPVDIAVVSERLTHKIRIFRLPDLQPLDNGGIEVYEGETEEDFRDLMGVALYKRPSDQAIFVIPGRKNGPEEGYLWQYLLEDDGTGAVKATLVRKFGKYSRKKEIEAIAVDDALGYIYYSDEGVGVRKYYADPEKENTELALFATTGVKGDHEGISIYAVNDSTGYILLSDQQSDQFHVFPREGAKGNPHQHDLIKIIKVSTHESDGSEICSVPLDSIFTKGLFVAMSDNKTFQLYKWEDLAGKDLKTFADK